MPSEAQIAANRSNAASFGLFAVHDFIIPGEEDQYTALAAAMLKQLARAGILEEAFASEIIRAAWRLHRGNAVEGNFDLDPRADPATERTQIALDRGRAHVHRTLQRSITELRVLQTERRIRRRFKLTFHRQAGASGRLQRSQSDVRRIGI